MNVKIKHKITKTMYLWGSNSDIEGKELQLIERNRFGDCLCMSPKGLVSVDREDVNQE